jgi:hypothetical protein
MVVLPWTRIWADGGPVSEDQDWRLKAELDVAEHRGPLDRLVGRVRDPRVVEEIGSAVADDVVITHDGKLLFAYAASEAGLRSARDAIESVLQRDGVSASITVSHWDVARDEWRQVDPPLDAAAQQAVAESDRDADAVEARTMIASAGKLVRAEVEQSMRSYADQLGLQCEVVEHPHLLTTQVAFTVTGPRRRIDEFAAALRGEEVATMRAEREVILSPL